MLPATIVKLRRRETTCPLEPARADIVQQPFIRPKRTMEPDRVVETRRHEFLVVVIPFVVRRWTAGVASSRGVESRKS